MEWEVRIIDDDGLDKASAEEEEKRRRLHFAEAVFMCKAQPFLIFF